MSKKYSPLSARRTALRVLQGIQASRGDAADLLSDLLPHTDRSGQATDLAYGVLRNSVLLDSLIKQFGNIDKANVKPALWDVLRLAVYELVFAPKTADYAIVNEAVNLATEIASQKAGGFVNAVLRNIRRSIALRDTKDAQTLEKTTVVPRSDGSGCLFAAAVLADPAAAPIEYLAKAWSLPRQLVRDWQAGYGLDAAAQLCRASNRHPSVYAWPNTLRIDAAALAERLTAEGVHCRLWASRGSVAIRGGGIAELPSFKEGLFYIQDPTAKAVADFIQPIAGQTFIDLCAAPGGKSVALALRMRDTGSILASDSDPIRLGRLHQTIARLGLTSIQVVCADDLPEAIQRLPRLDGILLDVPCSNTGVLSRRVEARRRLDRSHLESLFQCQQSLLKKAAELLKTDGKLIYSTCSNLPEENEIQLQRFLQTHPDFYLFGQHTTLASTENADGFDCDGGFVAVLRRKQPS